MKAVSSMLDILILLGLNKVNQAVGMTKVGHVKSKVSVGGREGEEVSWDYL